MGKGKGKGGGTRASLKRPAVYDALRREGHSKESAARISNALASKGKRKGKRK